MFGRTRLTVRGMVVLVVVCMLALGVQAVALAWTPTNTTTLGYTMNVLNHFNVTTLQDFSTGSDVEGRTYIGRDFTGANSAQFAIHLNSASTNDDALVVIRDIIAGSPLQIQYGSLYLGGTRNNRTINYNGGGTQYGSPEPDVTTMTTKLQNAGTQLSTYTANNSVTVSNGQATFNVTAVNSCGFAIFAVSAADIFSNQNINQVDINYNSFNPTGVIINVSGTTINWSGNANLIGNFTQSATRSKVLWNFYQATSINTNGKNMMGAVLAPLAAVTAQGNFDGHVVFKSLTTSSEAHLYSFTPNLTCLAPTASDLNSFSATTAKKGVRLNWETGSEVTMLGFNILRSAKKNGTYHALNAKPIPAKELGTLNGASYKFVDKGAVVGKRYFYKLEIVRASGSTYAGPIKTIRK